MNSIGFNCPVDLTSPDRIQIGHGGGGRLSYNLVRDLFVPLFSNPILAELHDGALLGRSELPLAITTDTHVVRPLFFPGGDIGALAVYGSVNDLAMCGARPRWLSVGFVLEEGLELSLLRRVVESMASAATRCGVQIVTGDTKVVERGHCDGMYINTTAVGEVLVPGPVGPSQIRAGDAVLVSGDIGRHGIAIISVREGLEFSGPIESDSAPVWEAVEALIEAGIQIHCLRDITRGGLATVLYELAQGARKRIVFEEDKIPVNPLVLGACEILGLDPLYVPSEGRFVAVVPGSEAHVALKVLQSIEISRGAAIIGHVEEADEGEVIMVTKVGARRVLDLLSGEQLPRIC